MFHLSPKSLGFTIHTGRGNLKIYTRESGQWLIRNRAIFQSGTTEEESEENSDQRPVTMRMSIMRSSTIDTSRPQVPAKWDATQMPSLDGKIAIVTGANSGIGYYTALELARKGAHVILACRNEQKALDAVTAMEKELENVENSGTLEFMQLDVSDLDSVHTFVQAFLLKHSRLDLLINNAGIMAVPYAETADGYESQFATNYLGHFALTAQLFGVLRRSKPSRIVNVTSLTHREAPDLLKNSIMLSQKKYNGVSAYNISKLCNTLFTMELNRRIKLSGILGVMAVVAHPGLTKSNLMEAPASKQGIVMRNVWKTFRAMPVFQTPQMGALPILYAAVGDEVQGGDYFGPNGVGNVWGHPARGAPSKQSQSADAGAKLWEFSEKLARLSLVIEK